MPEPREGESRKEYIPRCVSQVAGEGKSQEQALGQCFGMWRSAHGTSDEAATADDREDFLLRCVEMKTGEGVEKGKALDYCLLMWDGTGAKDSAEAGPPINLKKLADAYSRARKAGNDKKAAIDVAMDEIGAADDGRLIDSLSADFLRNLG